MAFMNLVITLKMISLTLSRSADTPQRSIEAKSEAVAEAEADQALDSEIIQMIANSISAL